MVGDCSGNVAYGTLASISESKFQFGLLYTGSDDGVVHVSKNGGVNWVDVSAQLPTPRFSCLVASSY